MKRWNIAITGFGAIGKTVARLLDERSVRYRQRYGADVRITAVCGSKAGLFDAGGLALSRLENTDDREQGLTGVAFLESVPADVLIEAGPTDYQTGGSGYRYLKAALAQGRHAIAISKGGLVFDYAGLHAQAVRQGVALKISGATSAALPTIDLLQYNLAGCEFSEVEGIFTATTNFVLSQMMEEGIGFAAALQEAQRRGMAEPDPRFDVQGWDTACKISILANAAFNAGIALNDVARDGIDHITPAEIAQWQRDRLVPKLVGSILRAQGQVSASVRLRLYAEDHPFARVQGTTKAIRVVTDAMGELLVIGGQSSQVATAAAALKDLEHILMRAC